MSREKNKDIRLSIRCIILCDNLLEVDIVIVSLKFNFRLLLLFYCYTEPLICSDLDNYRLCLLAIGRFCQTAHTPCLLRPPSHHKRMLLEVPGQFLL